MAERRLFQYAPTLRSYFELVDATDGVREKPDAKVLENVDGRVRYADISYRFVERPFLGHRRSPGTPAAASAPSDEAHAVAS